MAVMSTSRLHWFSQEDSFHHQQQPRQQQQQMPRSRASSSPGRRRRRTFAAAAAASSRRQGQGPKQGYAIQKNHFPNTKMTSSSMTMTIRPLLLWLLSSSCLFLHRAMAQTTTPTTSTTNWTFADLRPCPLSSLELSGLSASQNIDPCILYDLEPNDNIMNASSSHYNFTVTTVQITPTNCRDHRDGAPLAISKLNQDGFAIGFHQDFRLGFRHISIVAGNPSFLGQAGYLDIHTQLLDSLLAHTSNDYVYVIGSCSFTAASEKAVANQHEAILLAQVGPPSFYQSEFENIGNNNPQAQQSWVFGVHVSSDDYPRAAARKLSFYAQQQNANNLLQTLPVKIVARTSSAFFASTCLSALNELTSLGFQNIEHIVFDPDGDDNGNGVFNFQDEEFLRDFADQACPPRNNNNDNTDNEIQHRPALFLCTRTEQDILLARWRETGCLVTSLWLTAATWGWWYGDNLDAVLEIQGAGQWHAQFDYADRFFDSGVDMLQANVPRVGYLGGYDMLVSYVAPVLAAQHLQQAYRVLDVPTPEQDGKTPQGRELLRRRMLDLRVDTLFGPVQFNEIQRNNGRGSAAIQWQPDPNNVIRDNQDEEDYFLKSALISPDVQAEAEVRIPSAPARDCGAGEFHNVTLLQEQTAILGSVCDACPLNTFRGGPGQRLTCQACPSGTSTEGAMGASNCTAFEDNLLSTGMLSFGYLALSLSWLMAVVFLVWILVYRDDPVVRLAQIPYLILICVGGIISTSSILGVTQQAGHEESTDAADAGCRVVPILYSLGWVIQYGSLCSKTLRLRRVVEKSSGAKRTKITAWQTAHAVVIPLLIDVAILTAWTVVNPLSYVRSEEGRTFQDGVVTIESIGRCEPSTDDGSVWYFLGPLFANHLFLIGWTHYLLYQVRTVNNRYQENKYLGMAAIFALEVAIVGIPILIAARDSVEATFFVITGIVALDNTGVLCFIFVPKMFFQFKGLEEGVTVGESVLKDTHKQSVLRESGRMLSPNTSQQSQNSQYGSNRSPRGSGSEEDEYGFRSSAVLPSIVEGSESEELQPPSGVLMEQSPANKKNKYMSALSVDQSVGWSSNGEDVTTEKNTTMEEPPVTEMQPEAEDEPSPSVEKSAEGEEFGEEEFGKVQV